MTFLKPLSKFLSHHVPKIKIGFLPTMHHAVHIKKPAILIEWCWRLKSLQKCVFCSENTAFPRDWSFQNFGIGILKFRIVTLQTELLTQNVLKFYYNFRRVSNSRFSFHKTFCVINSKEKKKKEKKNHRAKSHRCCTQNTIFFFISKLNNYHESGKINLI